MCKIRIRIGFDFFVVLNGFLCEKGVDGCKVVFVFMLYFDDELYFFVLMI